MNAIVIYICCADEAQAERIGQAVMERKLAACANIIPGMRSLYRWQGKIESAQETVLLLKTRQELFEDCAALVRAEHSYEVPCIIALPVTQGVPDYLDWLDEQTTP